MISVDTVDNGLTLGKQPTEFCKNSIEVCQAHESQEEEFEPQKSQRQKFEIAMNTRYKRNLKEFNTYELSDHFKSFYNQWNLTSPLDVSNQ